MRIAKLLLKAINDPKRALSFIERFINYRVKRRRGVLIFIGMDPNGDFSSLYRGFKTCYGFEANPERYQQLRRKFGTYENVKLYNVAVSDKDGEVTFNISNNNNGASSSIGDFNEDWNREFNGEKIRMIKSITVPCINLNTFINKEGIYFIDEYISDIQGMDLEVLKTLKSLIDKKMIGSITCEVTKDNKKNVYHNLPDNSENGFAKLLNDNYSLVAMGFGILRNNQFDIIPDDAWEMDCKWVIKKN